MRYRTVFSFLCLVVSLLVVAGTAFAAPAPAKHRRKHPNALAAASKASTSATKTSINKRVRRGRAAARHSPWAAPTYADSTAGDRVDGEDLAVRRAAVEALGPYNGTVLAVDANTGRILTLVNQKLALTGGFQPCSTVKIAVALAALSEGLVDRVTPVHLYGRTRMDLTQALAHSNNFYFANLGIKLGYDRWAYYARLFGMGEKAGLDIPGEQAGFFASEPPRAAWG